MIDQSSESQVSLVHRRPDRKVGSAALGGAVSTVIIWLVGSVAGLQIPPEVAAAGTTIMTFVVAYLVPAEL